MSAYVEDNLLESETLIYMGRLSLWPYSLWIAFAMALILHFVILKFYAPLTLIGALLAFAVWVRYDSTELAVTSRRVIVKAGVVKRSTSELYLTRVEGVEVEQSVLGRLFNYGTIYVRGVGTEVAPAVNISRPIAFRRAFFTAADAYQEPSGKAV